MFESPTGITGKPAKVGAPKAVHVVAVAQAPVPLIPLTTGVVELLVRQLASLT